jgi:hypothetical protein
MRFWDSSALVPLVVAETSSDAVQREFDRDPELIVWWATDVECISALARRERESPPGQASIVDSIHRLAALSKSWREVQPLARVRMVAIRLLRGHPLRAGDAWQLSAAIIASEDNPATLPFVTLDDRLAQAAEREGFTVIRPA